MPPLQLTLALKSLRLCPARDEIYFQHALPSPVSLSRHPLAVQKQAVEMGQCVWARVVWYGEKQLLRLVTPLLPEVGRGLCFYYVDFGIWKKHFFQQNDVSNQISSALTGPKLHIAFLFLLFSGLEPQDLCGMA